MKIKALTSFSGSLSMRQGEEREVSEERAKELVDANFAEYMEESKKKAEQVDDVEKKETEEPVEPEKKEKIAPVQSKRKNKNED